MTPRELKMQVVLSLREKIIKPLQGIASGSSKTSREVKALRDEVKSLQAQNDKIESFRTLSKQTAIVGTELKSAKDRLKAFDAAMTATDKPARKLVEDWKAAKKEVNDLNAKHASMIERQRKLVTALGESGIKTNALSAHQRELKASINETSAALGKQEAKLKAVNANMQNRAAARAQYDKTMAARNRIAGAGTSMVIGGAVMSAPIVAAVRQYSSFEDAMLGVARQVDGARDSTGKLTKTYYEIGDEIKRLSQTIPLATTEIAAIVEAGARMGIQGKDNLLTFAKTTAMTAAAFDLPVDLVGEQMGKLSNLYKIPIKEISNLGDVINYLDDNALSKGGDIIDVMQRIAGTAATVNMGFKDAAALSSTFLSLGATAEIAATASNAMMRELAIATLQPKRFQAGLAALRLSAKEIQSGMSRDATGTIQRVLGAINKLPKEKQLGVTTQIFGDQFGDDAAKLANNLGEYRRQIELVNAAKARGSMLREAEIRNDALSSRYLMVKNRIFNQMARLGKTLRPSLVSLMTSLSGILGWLNDWTKKNPELTATLVKVAAVTAIVVASLGALMLGAAAVLGPFAMLKFSLGMLKLQPLTWELKGLSWAFGFLKTGILMVGRTVLWLGRALLMNPIGLIITGIALAAFLIYKYWEPIKAFFSGLWDAISSHFKIFIDAHIQSWQAVRGAVGSAAGWIRDKFTGLVNWFTGLPESFMRIGGQMVDGIINGLTTGWGRLKSKLTELAQMLPEPVRNALGIHSPSRVFAEIGDHTMAGLDMGLQRSATDPLRTAQSISGRIASIGAGVALSGAALAGTGGMAASQGGGTTIYSNDTIHITVQAAPGQDPEDIAQAVLRKLEERDRQRAARARARFTDRD